MPSLPSIALSHTIGIHYSFRPAQELLVHARYARYARSAVFPYAVVMYENDDFVNQLEYIDATAPTFRPFYFPNLLVTVSVQAGFRQYSAFSDLDGTTIAFPIWSEHINQLVHGAPDIVSQHRMERTLFPAARAVEFEVALIDEKTAKWIEPCSLDAPCVCSSFNGMVSANVSRANVLSLLRHLKYHDDRIADNNATAIETNSIKREDKREEWHIR